MVFQEKKNSENLIIKKYFADNMNYKYPWLITAANDEYMPQPASIRVQRASPR